MEFCMEAKALKSSLLLETAVNLTTQQDSVDDMWCLTGISNVGNSDDFSVDDLLDFSDKDFEPFLDENKEKECFSHDKGSIDDKIFNLTAPSSGDFKSLPAGELTVPVILHVQILMVES